MRFWLAMAAFLVWSSVVGYAQVGKETPQPAFDVVSVKPSGTNVVMMVGPGTMSTHTRKFRYSGDRVTCDLSLREIIQEAYSVRRFQVEGPDWIGASTFEVAAVMPAGTTNNRARLMLRTMLEQRFGLRLRRVQKDVPVYGLVEAKGGAKCQPLADPEQRKEQQKERLVNTRVGPQKGVTSIQGRGEYMAVATSMDDFAQALDNRADRPVVNLTNLKGAYDIDLRWEPDEGPDRSQHLDVELLRLIERQLGLKLESRKLTYEILAIDHVEKVPTEN